MALRVEQYVAIVPVLDVEKVWKYRVAGQTLCKILLRLIKFIAEVSLEEGVQRPVSGRELLLQVIDRTSVGNEFDYTWVGASYKYLVWSQENGQITHLREYLLQSFHQLKGQHFLAHVIVWLDNHWLERPTFVFDGVLRICLVFFEHILEFVDVGVAHALQINVRHAHILPSFVILIWFRTLFTLLRLFVKVRNR